MIHNIPTISTISSETISLYNPYNPLTKWDKETYNIITYNNNTIEKQLTKIEKPSILLTQIESIFNKYNIYLDKIIDDLINNSKIYFKIENTTTFIKLHKLKFDTTISIGYTNSDLIFNQTNNKLIQYTKNKKYEHNINKLIISHIKYISSLYPNNITLKRIITLNELI